MSQRTKKAYLKKQRSEKVKRQRYAILFYVFISLTAVAALVTAYIAGLGYASYNCAILHTGASAPRYVGLLEALPYALFTLALAVLSSLFFYKSKKRNRSCTEK